MNQGLDRQRGCRSYLRGQSSCTKIAVSVGTWSSIATCGPRCSCSWILEQTALASGKWGDIHTSRPRKSTTALPAQSRQHTISAIPLHAPVLSSRRQRPFSHFPRSRRQYSDNRILRNRCPLVRILPRGTSQYRQEQLNKRWIMRLRKSMSGPRGGIWRGERRDRLLARRYRMWRMRWYGIWDWKSIGRRFS